MYNEEDLKENSPGMTEEMRSLMRSSECLKEQLASYFGYKYEHDIDWCCSAVPQVERTAPATVAPRPAQPEGGEPAVAPVGVGREEVECEVDNMQSRRYVAEVGASTIAVEHFANEGSLDLEPARSGAEDWFEDDADEGEEVMEEDNVSESNEEVIETTNSAESHCAEKGESCGQSNQVKYSQKVTKESKKNV